MTKNVNGTNRSPVGLLPLLILSILGTPAAVFAQVDFSGEWKSLPHQVGPNTGATIGEYIGIPLNDAGRLKAESWDPAIRSLVERECIPHPMQYAEHSISNGEMRIWKVVDPTTQQLIAWQK